MSRQNGVPPLTLFVDRDGNIRPMVDLTGRFFRIEDIDPEYVQEQCHVEAYRPWAGRICKNAYDPALAPDAETLDVAICMMLKQQDSRSG